MAPQVGLEPTTTRLTAECSAIELLRNNDSENLLTLRHHLLESGGVLLSRAVASQVPSALRGLTSVFGMGTGGTLSPLPPEIEFLLSCLTYSVPPSVSFRLPFLPDTLYTHLYNCTVRVDLNATSRFRFRGIFRLGVLPSPPLTPAS